MRVDQSVDSHQMASSSNSFALSASSVVSNYTCNCGLFAQLSTSWSDTDPGRRYYCCPKSDGENCQFAYWVDEEMSERAKDIIRELKSDNHISLKERATLKKEVAMLRRRDAEKKLFIDSMITVEKELTLLIEHMKMDAEELKENVLKLQAMKEDNEIEIVTLTAEVQYLNKKLQAQEEENRKVVLELSFLRKIIATMIGVFLATIIGMRFV